MITANARVNIEFIEKTFPKRDKPKDKHAEILE
jgi:hypothetical protein